MKKVCVLFMTLVFALGSKGDEVAPRESMFLEDIRESCLYEALWVDGQTYFYPYVEGCQKDRFQCLNSESTAFDFVKMIILECPNSECSISATHLEGELKGDIINLYFGNQGLLSYKIMEVNETIFTDQMEVDDDEDKDILEITSIKCNPYSC